MVIALLGRRRHLTKTSLAGQEERHFSRGLSPLRP